MSLALYSISNLNKQIYNLEEIEVMKAESYETN